MRRSRLSYNQAMTKRHLFAGFLAICALAAGIVVYTQSEAADANTLIEVLQLKPGSVVAEIGAGDGELTVAMAKHVGASGRVFTSELGTDRVRRLRAAVEKAEATNVQVIEGHETQSNLPEACCDAVFMRNVYHHFGDPPLMNASFLRALKPGGRIAIIDFMPPKGESAAPGQRGEDGRHGVTRETLESELKAAGFEIVSSEDRARRGLIVVASKPAS
jgi:ubiquinone/menaquinone biosynthesis C-methylase UbiE